MNRKRILLILLFVFIIASTAVGIWQRNNIKAIVEFSRYSNKEISDKMVKDKEALKEEIKGSAPDLIRDFTPEEQQLIASGKVTIDEMVKKVLNEQSNASQNVKEDSATTKSSTSTSPSQSENASKINAVINEQVAKMYGFEAYYLGQLGSIESNAKSGATSSSADGKTVINRKTISQYINTAASLESKCDAKINAVLSSLKTQLVNLGGDVSIVDTLRNAYENEKSLKKAYYMSLLK